jgi:fucose 4-O-acetylase-like acetyltransferase
MPKDTDALTPSTNSGRPILVGPVRPVWPVRPAAKPRESRRDDSLDIAKGFGILLVVLGHCLEGLKTSGYFPPQLQWPTLTFFLIYLFHMPLFFVVSGHLASGKHRPARQVIARLVPTILYPYFLWSILEGLMLVYLSKYTNSHAQTSSLYSLYKILWAPIVPYWFLYALFFCHLWYLAIRRLPHWVQLAVAVAVFLAPMLFLQSVSYAYTQIVFETVRGFLYFVLGLVSVAQVRQFGQWTAIAATALFALFATIFYQSQLSGSYGAVAVLPAAVAGIVATLAWSRLIAAAQGRFTATFAQTFAFLGRYSMSIYVMHIFFTAGVRIALKRLAANPTAAVTAVEIVGATVLGIALPLGINWIVSKFDLDSWFGLQHMETS